MKTLVPYLTFGGNCREAFEFYKVCLLKWRNYRHANFRGSQNASG